jgi:hypothetical protein
MLDELVDGAGFAEAHFAFLRVHVDVDVPRLQVSHSAYEGWRS